MAIKIEQERKSTNWFAILLVAVIIVVLFLGAYFLFFKKPEVIELVVSGKFENITGLSQLRLDPQKILTSPQFKLLSQFAVDVVPPTPGRANPFAPY